MYQHNYNAVKAITRALRKEFNGIASHSSGYCCNSDYDAHHAYTNNEDYIDAKIYRGGLNSDLVNGELRVNLPVYFSWKLTNFDFNDVIDVMSTIAKRYGMIIVPPVDITTPEGKLIPKEYSCIVLTAPEEEHEG